jgi:single-strand DNA-binding protein
MNKVIIAGRLTRDPEVRTIPSGTSVADLGLALNERFKGKSGEWEERTTFVDVVVWGKQAETAGKYLQKGRTIIVEGALQMDEWTGKEGEKRRKMRIKSFGFQFLDSMKNREDTPTAGGEHTNKKKAAAPPSADTDDGDLPF